MKTTIKIQVEISEIEDFEKVQNLLSVVSEFGYTQHPALLGLNAIAQNWGLIPTAEEEETAGADKLGFITSKLELKTDGEVFDLYSMICTLLADHNDTQEGHPKEALQFATRGEMLVDITSLIDYIVGARPPRIPSR